MINNKALLEFTQPYYADKDIMHNMWHIELVQKMVDKILCNSDYTVDEECLKLATYFHGFIYLDEEKIKQWMIEQKYNMEKNVLNQNKCYLPETIPLCEEMNNFTNNFFADLKEGIQ